MSVCFIGIGSNLGDRLVNIKRAITKLGKLKGIKIDKISRRYNTKPEGFIKQDDFLNGAIRLTTSLSPRRLLSKLKHIESSMGRVKNSRFGPRIIDLDILFYGTRRIKTKDLIIPHPRMYKRDFVLKPLCDIAPELFKIRAISTISAMRSFVKQAYERRETIGFIPTMGSLHAGHLSLVRQAKYDCDKTVVSIFVNPAQFGAKEDFKKYPRDFRRDYKLLKQLGVDAIFVPSTAEMYPEGYLSCVNVGKITNCLCGLSRPGHFKGVATVVTKLFNIVSPDIAYFGQKDFQQARVIRALVKDLNIPVKIKLMPIVRGASGLAMSSRNVYLSKKQKSDAKVLYYSLINAKALIKAGERDARTVTSVIRNKIRKTKSARIDYVEIVDIQSLKKIKRISNKILIAVAVWFGKTRLIDNIVV